MSDERPTGKSALYDGREMYPCSHDVLTHEWFVSDQGKKAALERMPLHYERGHYWAPWPK